MGRNPILDNTWIMQELPPDRPTEIFLPVRMEIHPISRYDVRQDGWQGELFVEAFSGGMECGHCHPEQDEAWACIEEVARNLAGSIIAGHDGY